VSDDPRRPPAIVVEDVRKSFDIPREQVHTLKERALHPFRRPGHDTLRALRGVSFAVEPGEFFGIVGRNGSGKSTLLKCMAGIYRADGGRIFVDGRLSTFIELGVGFNPDLAAYDNVMLNATMLGLSTKEARRRFDKIIEFAELEPFVDLKVKNYSSGMLVRLAFSVMIQVDADVLLIDEVLAVGDAAFQQKCFDEFGRIRQSGATVLLVTHDMGAVQRFCDRAVLLEHGRVVEVGEVERVADRYLQLNFSQEARAEQAVAAAADDVDGAPAVDGEAVAIHAGPARPADEAQAAGDEAEAVEEDVAPDEHGSEPLRLGDRKVEILEAWTEDAEGARTDVVRTGRPASVCFRVAVNEPVTDPLFGINIYDSQNNNLFAANNIYDEQAGELAAGSEHVVRITFENFLAPDRYWITTAVAKDRHGLLWHDRRHRMIALVVTGTRPRDGMVALPFALDLQAAHDREEVGR
jgi:ABC-type polysaccharide/polyol phosphate transport system ATPase subunit